jgi:hypothetical protein
MTHARMIPTAYDVRWMMSDVVVRRTAHLCWVNPVYYPATGYMYVKGCTGGLLRQTSMVLYDGSRLKCKVCLALEAERDARLVERFPNCKSCRDLRDLLREVTEAFGGDYEVVLDHLDGKLRRKVNAVLSPLRPAEGK